jgi:hypothetical protein
MYSARSRGERERGAMVVTTKRPFTCEGHHNPIGGIHASKRRKLNRQTPSVSMNVTIYECMGVIFVDRKSIEMTLGQRVVELCESDCKDKGRASAFPVSRVAKCYADSLKKSSGEIENRFRTCAHTGMCALYAAVQSASEDNNSVSGPYVDAMVELGKMMTTSAS